MPLAGAKVGRKSRRGNCTTSEPGSPESGIHSRSRFTSGTLLGRARGEKGSGAREDRAGGMGGEGDQGRRQLGRVDEHGFMVFSLSVPCAARAAWQS